MGRALELITGLNTAPGASFTASTALTGNSFTVRDSRKPTVMLAQFDTRQGAGITRITSALLHDSTIGMQHGAPVGASSIIHTAPQRVMPQDVMGMQMTGSAVAGDIEFSSYLLRYDDLPGVEGRFITAADLSRRAANIFSNTITVATGTTGQYTGAVAVNSAQDSFKANTDYALLGYQVISGAVHAVRFVGPDWGNLGVGGPAILDTGNSLTSNWFARLGMIPLMNSANKSLTTIDAVADENGANPEVTMFWVELS